MNVIGLLLFSNVIPSTEEENKLSLPIAILMWLAHQFPASKIIFYTPWNECIFVEVQWFIKYIDLGEIEQTLDC